MTTYRWLNDLSQIFLDRDYLLPGQTTDDRVTQIAQAAERILKKPGFANKFKDYVARGWYSLSSPIWSNFGTSRGLPISCFGSYIDDTMDQYGGILSTHLEVGTMTKYGGGTSGYFGKLRGRGSPIRDNGHSSGSAHFSQLYETVINVVSQGSTRRGQFAGYQDIDHPDIEEWLTIRTDGSPIQNMSYGVCVSDEWLAAMDGGDMAKRRVWAKVLTQRAKTGYPYIFFSDNANRYAADVYRDDPQHRIWASNLCTEIMLPSKRLESFVCDLSSMNIRYFYEWKDTDAVEVLVQFLDAVMTEFIGKAEKLPNMERAVRFAVRHRALGIGWVGWHSFLQSEMVAFESAEAMRLTKLVGSTMWEQAYAASERLGAELGAAPVFFESQQGQECRIRRNTTLFAIAPTKSSAFILGQVSEGIEPNLSNYYIKDLQKGKFSIKNPYLEQVLEDEGWNVEDCWDSILHRGGSVQHLAFLSDEQKAVFKTFAEISPMSVVQQAAYRQKWIDQGQSLNLMIHPSIPAKDVNQVMLAAWRLGLKSLYYQKSVNAAQEYARNITTCTACEG